MKLLVMVCCNNVCIQTLHDDRMLITQYSGFTRVPRSFNVTEGSEVMFTCEHASTNAIEWFINKTLWFADDFPPSIAVNNLNASDGTTVHSLLIHQPTANYNGTVIQCAAFVEKQPEKTLPSVLLVQG